MRPGQAIEIQLVDLQGRRVRLPNVLMMITLFEKGGHYRYVFELGLTAPGGSIRADRAGLDHQRMEEGLYSLMDYNTPLAECAPEVEISVPGEEGLRDREKGIWELNPRTVPVWLVKWPANGALAPVQPRRVTLDGAVTRLEIPVSLPTDDSGRP